MTPQIEFRGGNGHTSKTIVIRSGSFFQPFSENLLLEKLAENGEFYGSQGLILTTADEKSRF